MENRFGIKDFFLFALLLVLIITIVVAMRQFDRQYEEVLSIKKSVNDQTIDLNNIKSQLARGVVSRPGPNSNSNSTATTQSAGGIL